MCCLYVVYVCYMKATPFIMMKIGDVGGGSVKGLLLTLSL